MSHTQTKKIGVATATIVGMNAMIGSGIFTAPATMASHVGPAGILAYLFVVGAIWFMASSIARLAYLFPEEGSFYTYTKQWAGHRGGLLSVSLYFVGLLIAMGLLSRMAGVYLHPIFPMLSEYQLGLIALFALVILNMFGVIFSELGQRILITCTVFPLIATIILCLSKASLSNLIPFAPHGIANVLKATRVVIFGFFGFECASSLFTIVKNPARNVPRALTYSIIFVGLLYTMFIASIILSTPLEYFVSPTQRISDILLITFPYNPWLVKLIHFSILSAIIGTVHSMIWSSSCLLVLIVNKLKSPLAKKIQAAHIVNQKSSVIIVGGAIFLSYITLKNPDLFFSITATCLVSSFILSMITLLTIPEEWKSQQNIKTILGIITATIILIFAVEGLSHELIKILSN